MHAHTRLELKWFSKTRMNRDFLEEAVTRAARKDEVKVNWIWKDVKWTDKVSTRRLILAEVENGSRKCYLVALSPGLRRMWCDCPDFKYRCSNGTKVFYPCKHIWAVISALNRQEEEKKIETPDRAYEEFCEDEAMRNHVNYFA